MALSGAPERTTIVTSNASLSLQTTQCRLLRRVVPWSPVIPMELVPIEPGGDMLRQFLESNDDLLEHTVFGVSAQGGDITVDEQKKALLDLDDALKRIKVVHGTETSQDITKPIAWLLEER